MVSWFHAGKIGPTVAALMTK